MSDQICYQDEYFTIKERQPNERYIQCRAGVMIVPLTDDNEIIFIKEPSPAFDEAVMILPGGQLDQADETPAQTANRELQEEVGFEAARLDHLGTVYPWSKYLQSQLHLFLARDLTPHQKEGDEDFEIQIERVPFDQFEALIEAGQVRDASVIAALFMARRFLTQDPDKDPHIM